MCGVGLDCSCYEMGRLEVEFEAAALFRDDETRLKLRLDQGRRV